AITTGGGRRDGEKIGRSRVVDSLKSGISQSGLGLSVRWGAGGWGSGVGAIMTGAGVAGCSQTDEIGGASARCGALGSGASVGSASVAAGATIAVASSKMSVARCLLVSRNLMISRLAIARTR